MKKSIKNLEVKSIKNIKAVKGGEDNLGDRAKAIEYVIRVSDDI
jgi:hypothetical protein